MAIPTKSILSTFAKSRAGQATITTGAITAGAYAIPTAAAAGLSNLGGGGGGGGLGGSNIIKGIVYLLLITVILVVALPAIRKAIR
ncbi:hypothetical protein [Methanocorpusculum vombati]|uniref:Uncharacterized protein n=1 Tax=Methanocorpusculum vombati TaxID=3002864 RepID=A0ABT4IKI6_9EURY|nr:hypothetical protein [Methanocorpusculum vombati]MCZ9319564.1 hypothetical protein [Methanocorpusculum sp.]MCZ0862254.1 hypothetical protein [Methanocorpusculum vombati]MDE2519732.1 hypothetical protein [Methanocorpusculum sp.]MDE2534486.1 hypothetical protein [Methanocorpusculum sp.]MDE2546135.1 hypothetical protein [Methanocorpusculum sp.]